ncbi:MAG: methyltransferase domain-containing protein [Oscillospiraceae bacterium]|nr:methyltransferase domain-containing protein [Oscillospiraceae bacterium]
MKIRPVDIACKSKHSLVHIGSLDSFDLTPGGIDAARNILRYFDTQDKSCLENAMRAYDRLIPTENFGGEYTALRWICMILLAPSPKLTKHFFDEPTVKGWYDYLSENDFEKLKTYLEYKYHFKPLSPKDTTNTRMFRFLEDFILFSNPDRERWEKTRKILRKLRIDYGLTIADVGCGSGYFTFKFANMVGSSGKVYGIEINSLHLDYLRKFVRNNKIKNVEIVESNSDGIGLSPDVKADIVFSCSLFHVLYAVFKEEDRFAFMKSIKNTLNPDGALIIMDNDLVTDGNLPYHGPYIAKDLLVSQLYYYGFKLVKKVQVTKQRYALIFKQCEVVSMEDNTNLGKGIISAMSGVSLVKYALADATPEERYTENGRDAAGLFIRALTDKTPDSIDATIAAYEKIIPNERIGDEYTAFVWFCEYLKADEQARSQMTADPLVKEYFDYLSENDFALLKEYLLNRYELLPDKGHTMEKVDLMNIGEHIAFNNPARERWEKTNQMLDCINIKPGEIIADVGCGSGYFTYKFANLTGPSGKVYATEINKDALSYVESLRDKYNLNIIPVVSALNDAKLPDGQFDKIYMCSMYHAVYVASIEFVKDGFIGSIKTALKDDGKLIVVDNEITREGVPDYHGSGIDRRLAISQLEHYGFRLTDEKQFIPQRYILIFQKENGKK